MAERTPSLPTEATPAGPGPTPGPDRSAWSSEPPVVAGDCLARYTVRSRIGAGGMGEVFAAHDPELDRLVALKVLRSDVAGPSPEARARFQREAQAMARLNHPNVVSVFDVGSVGERVFVAMELVAGAHPRHLADPGAAHLARGPRRLSPGWPRARSRPSGRHRAPRLQAGQRDRRRSDARGRLRPRPWPEGATAAQYRDHSTRRRRDPHRSDPRHAGIHGTRAERGPSGHASKRPVLVRGRIGRGAGPGARRAGSTTGSGRSRSCAAPRRPLPVDARAAR